MKQNIKKEYESIVTASRILQPTLTGLVCYLVIYAALVIPTFFSQYTQNLVDLKVSDFQGTFLYSPIHGFIGFTNNAKVGFIAYFGFWLAIGLVVYLIASALTHYEVEFAHNLIVRHYVMPKGADRNRPLKTFFLRSIIKIAALIVIIAFIVKGLPAIDNWWKHHNGAQSASTYLELLVFVVLG